MLREFTCIVCPNGCEITAEYDDTSIRSISGALCPKGEAYVKQELTEPKRTIATSILVHGGELPLASVRITEAIPKALIFDAVKAIQAITVQAPVTAGTVILSNLLNTGADVIITRTVAAKKDAPSA